jgi:hypothetical protein
MVLVTHRAPPLVALAALSVLLPACHGGGGNASSTTKAGATSSSTSSTTSVSPTTSTSTTVATTAAPPTAPCGPARQADKGATVGAPSETLLLTAVTVRHTARCTDEVVFGFAASGSSPPGVTVKIVHPPFTLAGSGAAVTVAGQRFYEVQFQPASTFDFEAGHASYTGPSSIVATGTSHVRQVVNTDAFEGVVTWIVGVGADDQFVFKETASPPSLTLTF